MPTIANMPAANVEVTFPSGETRTVNLIRLLAQAQNAEFKAKHGVFLPGVAKLHPTLKAIRDEYEIPFSACRTWQDAAMQLRRFHTTLTEHVEKYRR